MHCERCGSEALEFTCSLCRFILDEEEAHRESARVALDRRAHHRRMSDETVGCVSHEHRALAEMFWFQAEAFAARAAGFRAQLDARKTKSRAA